MAKIAKNTSVAVNKSSPPLKEVTVEKVNVTQESQSNPQGNQNQPHAPNLDTQPILEEAKLIREETPVSPDSQGEPKTVTPEQTDQIVDSEYASENQKINVSQTNSSLVTESYAEANSHFQLAYNTLPMTVSSVLAYNTISTSPAYVLLSYNQAPSLVFGQNTVSTNLLSYNSTISDLGLGTGKFALASNAKYAAFVSTDPYVFAHTPLALQLQLPFTVYQARFEILPPSTNNFFIKAATTLTGILNELFGNEQQEQQPQAQTLSPFTSFKVADTSGFFNTALVSNIPHVILDKNFTSVVGDRITVQDGNNHIYSIGSSIFSPVNSSDAVDSIPSIASSNLGDFTYMLRQAATGAPLSLNASNTRAGALIINPIASTLAQAAPDLVNLTLSQNNFYQMSDRSHGFVFASAKVPSYIASTVTGPANALVIYNLMNASVPNATSPNVLIYPISDYSPNSVITSLHVGMGLGAFISSTLAQLPTYGYNVVIDASNHLTVVVNNVNVSFLGGKGLIWVDSNLAIKGQATFSAIQNPGFVVDKGQYSYVNVNDFNKDGTSDLLFGSVNTGDAILLYGSLAFPALVRLDDPIPNNIEYAKFILPTPNIVGIPLASGANPADGGAALNAVSTKTAGVNFIGDVNGDGFVDILVQKFSSDYSYDSDLAYIIYGQKTYLPENVNLISYGDNNLKNGIVGIGTDADGNFVQNVKGFTVTGPVINVNGDVGPDNFSVKGIGDLNADGYGELLAFANNNAAYLLFGHPTISTIASNINLGVITPYELPFFLLPNVASSTEVPSIKDFNGGRINNDAFDDILINPSISYTDLLNQTIPFVSYLSNVSTGSTHLGTVLSGAVLTNNYFATANNVSGTLGLPVGSAYMFKTEGGLFDTSHIILGIDNRAIIEGFSGIDNLIGGTANQLLRQNAPGTINSNLPGIVGSTLIGGNGNNIFEVVDPVFHMVRGGIGFDILRLNSGRLDLTNAPDPSAANLVDRAAHIVSGIERIELGDDARLIISPETFFAINNANFNSGVLSFLGNNDAGTAIRGGLLIASTNLAAQDPSKAPTLELHGDADHQWSISGSNAGIEDGLALSTYQLLTKSPPTSAQQSTILVEQNVNVVIHN